MHDELKKISDRMATLSEQAQIRELWDLDDQVLWALHRQGSKSALTVLFRKYNRHIIVFAYQKMNAETGAGLEDIQDAFGEFVERILAGQYEKDLQANFTAFGVHHLSFLIRGKMRTLRRRERLRRELVSSSENDGQWPKIGEHLDLGRVIDCIPSVANRMYRMVLYLMFVQGYDSHDLTLVFGKAEMAHDKRYRAMQAFRKQLQREGILEELK